PVRLLKLNIAAFVDTGNMIDPKKLNLLLDDVADGRTILFIDEAHILAQQPPGATDFFNYTKDKLTGGELRLIISTTKKESEKFLSKDKAMGRRFKVVEVSAPDSGETREILENITGQLLEEVNTADIEPEEYVSLGQEPGLVLEQLVKLSNRFKVGAGQPDGAIDALRTTLHWIRQRRGENKRTLDRYAEMTVTAINKLIELRNNTQESTYLNESRQREAIKIINRIISLLETFKQRDESFRFSLETGDVVKANGFTQGGEAQENKEWILGIEERLKERIHGQDHCVSAVAKSVIIDRLGMRNRKLPAGVFYNAGPTGCGKTFLPQVLAKELYPGDEEALIRIDMTKYPSKFDIYRLIGAPPGYVGYDDPPELLEKVKRRPHSVVVFDEADKAHPEIFKFFLNLLETGQYNGVDFSKAFIFFTSNENLSAEDYRKSPEQIIKKVNASINANYKPEFLGRLEPLGGVLIFNFLSRAKMVDIVRKNLFKAIKQNFSDELGIDVEIEPGVPDFEQAEQFSLDVRAPFMITDEGVVFYYDPERATLKRIKRGDEFVISKMQGAGAETENFNFEEGALNAPAMIKIIKKNGRITDYLVADKEAGIVCFDGQGNLKDVIAEPTDKISVIGKRVFFYSLKDGFIKSCLLSGKNKKKYSERAYPELTAMAAEEKNSSLLNMCLTTGNNQAILLNAKGKEDKVIELEHTDEIQAKVSPLERKLRQVLDGDFARKITTDRSGARYWLDIERNVVIKQVQGKEFEEIIALEEKAVPDIGFMDRSSLQQKNKYLPRILVDKIGFVYVYDQKDDIVIKFNKSGKLVKSSEAVGNIVENI
ncbi:MAG: ATP-dependent Clp protease ATP-binding subunit, partial [Candidatus Pacebacteria bacterium]|nr:ATP-dependent Clp protease ATP-binding subunit [Candidatus Paceibacterota bacterium]